MTDDIHRPATSDRDPVDLSRWSKAHTSGRLVSAGRRRIMRRFIHNRTRPPKHEEDGN